MECECFEANTANGKFKSPYKQTLGERGLIEEDVTIEMLSAPKRAKVTSREAWQPQKLHRKVYCSKLEQQHVKLDYKNFNGSENILKFIIYTIIHWNVQKLNHHIPAHLGMNESFPHRRNFLVVIFIKWIQSKNSTANLYGNRISEGISGAKIPQNFDEITKLFISSKSDWKS